MEIATLLYISGALTGTVVGDAYDQLSINEEENKPTITQQVCETVTTTDNNGLVSKVETCKTFKTISN